MPEKLHVQVILLSLMGAVLFLPEQSDGQQKPTEKPTPAKPGEVSVLYADYGTPDKLTDERMAEILRIVEKRKPAKKEIWFMLVLRNRSNDPNDYHVLLYLKPDETSARLRKGRYFGVGGWREIIYRKREEKNLALGKEEPREKGWEYVQVSEEDKAFGDELKVPTVITLPFGPPETSFGGGLADVSDKDLIAIVDCARSAVREAKFLHKPEPICRVFVEKDEIRVETGWQVGPLAGSGHSVRIKRTPKGFEPTGGVGFWVS